MSNGDTQVIRLEDLFKVECLDDTKPATQTQRIWVGGDLVPVAERICLECNELGACGDCATQMNPESFGGY